MEKSRKPVKLTLGERARESLFHYTSRPKPLLSAMEPPTEENVDRGECRRPVRVDPYTNMMFDQHVKRGLYTVKKDMDNGLQPSLPLGTKIPKCPLRKTSATQVMKQFDCGAVRQTVPSTKLISFTSLLGTCSDPKSNCGNGKVKVQETTFRLWKNLGVPRSFREELMLSSNCWNHIGVQTNKSYLRPVKKYSIYSQTEPDIGLVTGVGDSDETTSTVASSDKTDWIKTSAMPRLKKSFKLTRMVNTSSQTCSTQVFNFNLETEEIIQKLAEAVVLQSVTEFEDEQELQVLLDQQNIYKFGYTRARDRLGRFMDREQDLEYRRKKAIKRGVTTMKRNVVAEDRIKIGLFAHCYLLKLSKTSVDSLKREGALDGDKEEDICKNVIPWVQEEVSKTLFRKKLSCGILDDIIHHVVNYRELETAVGLYGEIRVMHLKAMVEFEQRSRSLETEENAAIFLNQMKKREVEEKVVEEDVEDVEEEEDESYSSSFSTEESNPGGRSSSSKSSESVESFGPDPDPNHSSSSDDGSDESYMKRWEAKHPY